MNSKHHHKNSKSVTTVHRAHPTTKTFSKIHHLRVHHIKKSVSRPIEREVAPRADKEPEYMIQVSDPKMLRKDLLESLREVIIFMQGYETFRKIQEEKVALFTVLKAQVREINSLVDIKLKKYVPKGKLRGISEQQQQREEQHEEETLPGEPRIEVVPIERVQVQPRAVEKPVARAPPNELDELEKQLRDIENQLQNIQ